MLKKALAIILLAVSAFTASAEFRWGPQVGYNYSDFYWKQDLVSSKGTSGFQAGLVGEVMIPGIGFGIDFGLLYNMHGGKVDFESVWLHQLSVPLHLRFKYTRFGGLERTIAPFAYAGPEFNFTLGHGGNAPLEYPAGSVGVQVGLGAELFQRLQVSLSYTWGLTYEIRTIKLDNFSARSQHWGVNVAWFF